MSPSSSVAASKDSVQPKTIQAISVATGFCASALCVNGGTCIPTSSGYTCQCPINYQGDHCEIPVFKRANLKKCYDRNSSRRKRRRKGKGKTCDNGLCQKNSEGRYDCDCEPGWIGTFCSIQEEPIMTELNILSQSKGSSDANTIVLMQQQMTDTCATSVCGNGATCVPGRKDYACVCPPRYAGKHCNHDNLGTANVRRCTSLTCEHGKCIQNENKRFDCICDDGWAGVFCSVKETDLQKMMLKERGQTNVLMDIYKIESQTTTVPITTTEAKSSSINSGARLPTISTTSTTTTEIPITTSTFRTEPSSPKAEATTQPLSSSSPGDTSKTSIEPHAHPAVFVVTGFCASALCVNGGTCIPTSSGYTCQCPINYQGDHCEIPVFKRANLKKCYDRNSSRRKRRRKGKGKTCDNGLCQKNSDGRYDCDCERGWIGTFCSIQEEPIMTELNILAQSEGSSNANTIVSMQQQMTDTCATSVCGNGATCVPGRKDYACVCPPRYAGKHCNHDNFGTANVRRCTRLTCEHGKCIQNDNKRFDCICDDGWAGVFCSVAKADLQKMMLKERGQTNVHSDTDKIESQATTVAMKTTEAKSSSSNSGAGLPTISTNSTRTTEIPLTTSTVRSEPSSSKTEATTQPLFSSSSAAVLKTSVELHANPAVSVATGFCASALCVNGGTCIPASSGYTCQCPIQYQGDHCEIPVLKKANLKKCYDRNSSRRKRRRKGRGKTCDNGLCQKNSDGRYDCDCEPGWIGTFCSIQEEPFMTELNILAQSKGSSDANSIVSRQQQMIDTCATSVCGNGATCVPGRKDYVCVCPPRYVGKYCNHDNLGTANVRRCTSLTCEHGKCIQNENKRFDCICDDGWAGVFCSVTEADLQKMILKVGKQTTGTTHAIESQTSSIPSTTTEAQSSAINSEATLPTISTTPTTTTNIPITTTTERSESASPITETTQPSASSAAEATSKSLVEPHAIQSVSFATGFCASALCVNGGTCLQTFTGYTCQCPIHYQGDHCEIPVLKRANLKKCFDQNSSRRKRRRKGKGKTCDNGLCQKNSDGRYDCDCEPGWIGTFCSIQEEPFMRELNSFAHAQDSSIATSIVSKQQQMIDTCATSVCGNGATCVPGRKGYDCVCQPRYAGKHCNHDNFGKANIQRCKGRTCEHGRCIQNENNRFDCICDDGWAGVFCGVTEAELEMMILQAKDQTSVPTDKQQIEVQTTTVPITTGAESSSIHSKTISTIATTTTTTEPPITTAIPMTTSTKSSTTNSGPAMPTILTTTTGTETLMTPSTPSVNFEVIPAVSVATGFCAAALCVNGATCNPTSSGYTCQCPIHYQGDHCEIPVLKRANLKKCFDRNSNRRKRRRRGKGRTCENGLCQVNAVGRYDCDCEMGWLGTFCSISVEPFMTELNAFAKSQGNSDASSIVSMQQQMTDTCATSVCGNGATCVPGRKDYTCVCPPRFAGKHCNHDNYGKANVLKCTSLTCEHGRCIQNERNRFDCLCYSGWAGALCSVTETDLQMMILKDKTPLSVDNNGRSLPTIEGIEQTEQSSIDHSILDGAVTTPPTTTEGQTPSISTGSLVPATMSAIPSTAPQTITDSIEDSQNKLDVQSSKPQVTTPPSTKSIDTEVISQGSEDVSVPSGFCTTSSCENESERPSIPSEATITTDTPGTTSIQSMTTAQSNTPSQSTTQEAIAGMTRSSSTVSSSETRSSRTSEDTSESGSQATSTAVPIEPAELTTRTMVTSSLDVSSVLTEETPDIKRISSLRCASAICVNGGICKPTLLGYVCLCPPHFQGEHCNIPVFKRANLKRCFDKTKPGKRRKRKKRMNKTCKNGVCSGNADGRYDCECESGWVGSLCDTPEQPLMADLQAYVEQAELGDINSIIHTQQSETSPCASSACTNGATCVDKRRGYTCICPLRFAGKYCNHDKTKNANVLTCTSDTCNHGSCEQNEQSRFDCACNQGWAGAFCSITESDLGKLIIELSSQPSVVPETSQMPDFLVTSQVTSTKTPQVTERTEQESPTTSTLTRAEDKTPTVPPTTQRPSDATTVSVTQGVEVDILTSTTPSTSTFSATVSPLSASTIIPSLTLPPTDEVPGMEPRTRTSGFCMSALCMHGASCISTQRGYTCQCPPHFHGDHCEIPVFKRLDLKKCFDKFSSVERKSQRRTCVNGLCTQNHDGRFDCACDSGWIGTLCDTKEQPLMSELESYAISERLNSRTLISEQEQLSGPCSLSVCGNGGTCVPERRQYSCVCPQRYGGKHCNHDHLRPANVLRCTDKTCINGQCRMNENNRFDCECDKGWAGAFCSITQIELQELIDSDVPLSSTSSPDLTTTELPTSKVDERIPSKVNISFTTPSMLPIVTTTIETTTEIPSTTETKTESTIAFTTQAPPVSDTLPSGVCVSALCVNGGTCSPTEAGYLCQCPPHYRGDHCEVPLFKLATMKRCSNRKRKNRKTRKCNNGSCSKHGNRLYGCVCEAGWIGNRCDVQEDTFRETLQEFDPTANLDSIISEQQALTDSCASAACANMATCMAHGRKYKCICPPRYAGKYCNHDNFRRANVSRCAKRTCKYGKCRENDDNRFDCLCDGGWAGAFCDVKEEQLKLISESQNIPVSTTTAAATETEPLLTTTLSPSPMTTIFSSTTQRAPIIDILKMNGSCRVSRCMNGAQCVPKDNGFTCVCSPLFKGSFCEIPVLRQADLFTCRNGTNQDESDQQMNCINGVCVLNVFGKYDCKCNQGWIGTFCSIKLEPFMLKLAEYAKANIIGDPSNLMKAQQQLRGPCARSTCANGGTCIPVRDSYRCECPPQFEGRHCNYDVFGKADMETCIDTICGHGSCLINEEGRYDCECEEGYTGIFCSFEEPKLLERLQNNLPDLGLTATSQQCGDVTCLNGGRCVTEGNSFICACPDDFFGQYCEFRKHDPCVDVICQNSGSCVVDSLSGNRWMCVCQPGFTGVLCEENVNECTSMPCQNHGTCVDKVNGFECSCTISYTGTLCDLDNHCKSNPCKNSGSCTSTVEWFTCACATGFEGEQCGVDINECDKNPCLNNGKCINTPGSFECECQDGYDGNLCEYDIDECSSNPCLNGAECLNQVNKYQCECPHGYDGRNCEKELDQCEENPCKNGGLCNTLEEDFKCTCLIGFRGKLCEQKHEPCKKDPCGLDGVCVVTKDSYQCVCSDGFTGKHCDVKIDRCKTRPCQNQGTCVNLISSFQCQCPTGFKGDLCQHRVIQCSSSPCQNGGLCLEDENGIHSCECKAGFRGQLCELEFSPCDDDPCGFNGVCVLTEESYQCVCSDGFGGQHCDKERNRCDGHPCQNDGTCLNLVDSFRCLCADGYSGDVCQHKSGTCESGPCKNGGNCTDNDSGFSCVCPEGFIGDTCEETNRCSNKPCQNGAICISEEAGIRCICRIGFTGQKCEVETNECDSLPCLNDGSCTDGIGTYSCQCAEGYVGEHCENKKEKTAVGEQDQQTLLQCNPNPCKNFGICSLGLLGSVICTCPTGFTGKLCGIPFSPCDSQPCLNKGTCEIDGTGFRCVCADGFEGVNCQGVILPTECPDGTCRVGGACKVLKQDQSCKCSNDKCRILTKKDICGPDSCLNQGSCLNVANVIEVCPKEGNCVKQRFAFSCQCPVGYTGQRCEVQINPCSSSPCGANGDCNPDWKQNAYRCQCFDGFSGENCMVRDLCKSNPCKNGGLCAMTKESNNFICKCQAGFTGRDCSSTVNRTTIAAPSKRGPVESLEVSRPELTGPCTTESCSNNGSCLAKERGHICVCSWHFMGSVCEIAVVNNRCEKKSCYNGGICQNVVGEATKCICPEAYTGYRCEDYLDRCLDHPCLPHEKCNVIHTDFKVGFECVVVDGTQKDIHVDFLLIGSVAGVVFVLTVVIFAICLYYRVCWKKSKRTGGKDYAPLMENESDISLSREDEENRNFNCSVPYDDDDEDDDDSDDERSNLIVKRLKYADVDSSDDEL